MLLSLVNQLNTTPLEWYICYFQYRFAFKCTEQEYVLAVHEER
jgi:hypothetical protein